MNIRAKNLPSHWQEWVSNHPALRDGLSTEEFSDEVFLYYEDGSSSHFKYAFFVKNEEMKDICVFTEHCGYHCVSLIGLEEVYSKKGRNEIHTRL